jgi:nitrite reductase (NADH) small subunit
MATRIASVDDIPAGEGREFTVGDRVLAVFNVDGEFHVIDGICPHAGGPLADGGLHGGIVTCPWHGWQFDVTTGRHCLTERIQQTRFACRVENGEVLVELPDPT